MTADQSPVVRFADIDAPPLEALLERYDLALERVPDHATIPASFWGDEEAGISGNRVYVRGDTPVHSVLHEAAHVICMSPDRRANLHRDAGGTDLEESAVCYLEILLASEIAEVGSDRLMQDMDRWGYSFRLGSTRRWFEEDAEDARAFLRGHGIIDSNGRLTGRCRGEAASPC